MRNRFDCWRGEVSRCGWDLNCWLALLFLQEETVEVKGRRGSCGLIILLAELEKPIEIPEVSLHPAADSCLATCKRGAVVATAHGVVSSGLSEVF